MRTKCRFHSSLCVNLLPCPSTGGLTAAPSARERCTDRGRPSTQAVAGWVCPNGADQGQAAGRGCHAAGRCLCRCQCGTQGRACRSHRQSGNSHVSAPALPDSVHLLQCTCKNAYSCVAKSRNGVHTHLRTYAHHVRWHAKYCSAPGRATSPFQHAQTLSCTVLACGTRCACSCRPRWCGFCTYFCSHIYCHAAFRRAIRGRRMSSS